MTKHKHKPQFLWQNKNSTVHERDCLQHAIDGDKDKYLYTHSIAKTNTTNINTKTQTQKFSAQHPCDGVKDKNTNTHCKKNTKNIFKKLRQYKNMIYSQEYFPYQTR